MSESKEKKKLLFSVTADDFEITNITCRGAGGQNINRRHNGVRIVHPASGARAESCQERSQPQNKEIAFNKLVNSKEFLRWHKLETSRRMLNYQSIEQMIEKAVDEAMLSSNIKTEIRNNKGQWEVADPSELKE